MDAEPSEDTEFQLLGIPCEDESHRLRSREPFELLASQFVEELRAGRKPSIELFARRFPPHATKIRDVFPVLAMLEHARIEKESQSIRRNMPDRFPFNRLGNCELLCELGRGGMGVVYQGRDIESGHLVAVKILPWRVSVVPEWVDRFEREARTAAQLRHKNIVPVFRYGQENGYCFFVMQLVNGVGLDRLISALGSTPSKGSVSLPELLQKEIADRRGYQPIITPKAAMKDPDALREERISRMSWMTFASIAIQTTQALRSAHAAGILHNDIKPGNLLLDADGRVWITDFGLSRHIEPATALRPGDRSISGTLRYMAPERFSGTQNETCDLYSLGATLYELCLQQAPHDVSDRDLLIERIRTQDPVAPREICRDIPRGLETIILNALARNPADRYHSAEAMLGDLLRFSMNKPVHATYRRSLSNLFRNVRGFFRRD